MLPRSDKHQPDSQPSARPRRPLPEILRTLSAVARHMHSERGRAREFRRALHRLQVPMVTVANDRRVLDANLASRLLLHLSLDELKRRRVDDLIEPREAVRLARPMGAAARARRDARNSRAFRRQNPVCASSWWRSRMSCRVSICGAGAGGVAGRRAHGSRATDPQPDDPGPLRSRAGGARARRRGVLVEGDRRAACDLRGHGQDSSPQREPKLGARNRAHAVGLALKLGLIGPEEASP